MMAIMMVISVIVFLTFLVTLPACIICDIIRERKRKKERMRLEEEWTKEPILLRRYDDDLHLYS